MGNRKYSVNLGLFFFCLFFFSIESRASCETDFAKVVEDRVVSFLKKMQEHNSESKTEVSEWIKELEVKQGNGEKLTLMEHTAIVHAAKKKIIDENTAEKLLTQSWKDFTGEEKDLKSILATQTPEKFLKDSSYREKAFHASAFAEVQRKKIPTIIKVLGTAAALTYAISEATGIPVAETLAGMFMGYTISSMAEYLTHRFYLHPSQKTRSFWDSLGLRKGYRFHIDEHHHMFTQHDYAMEVNEEWLNAEPHETDERLRIIPPRDERAEKEGYNPEDLHNNQYGMSFNGKEVAQGTVLMGAAAATLSYAFGFGPEGYIASMLVAPLTTQTTKYLHPLLHMAGDNAKAVGNRFTRYILGTRYWKFVSRIHFLHHARPSKANFSLFLPGPDSLFNTLEEPNLPMLLNMDEMQIPY